MPWIIVFLSVGLIGLNCAFILSALALKRNVDQRRDAFRLRLEHDANAIVDVLLQSKDADGVRPDSRATNE